LYNLADEIDTYQSVDIINGWLHGHPKANAGEKEGLVDIPLLRKTESSCIDRLPLISVPFPGRSTPIALEPPCTNRSGVAAPIADPAPGITTVFIDDLQLSKNILFHSLPRGFKSP